MFIQHCIHGLNPLNNALFHNYLNLLKTFFNVLSFLSIS